MNDNRIRVWLDTETTRLDHNRRPWEIALIRREPGQADTEHRWFVDADDLDLPGADPNSLIFGRFWERHPHGGRTTYSIASEIRALFEVAGLTAGAVVHGSNPHFDTEMLAARMRERGLADPTWHYHLEDVPGVARGWLLGRGTAAPSKSDDISRWCGVEPSAYDRHTALGDCRWMRDLSDVIEPRTDLTAA